MKVPVPCINTPHYHVAYEITKALALLHAAERHFRHHHTDAAVNLLIEAEARVTSAHETLHRVTCEHRFAAQRHIDNAQSKLEAFRIGLAEV